MKNINENKQNNIEIINISDYFIKINLNNPEIREFKIIKSERASFKKDDNIVKYILKGKNDINYVKSPIYGWIEKYDENDKTLILQKCKHEMFYGNLCVKCEYKKTEQDEKFIKSYGFTKNNFYLSKEKAESLEKAQVEDYLTAKKLILLLDLDNTILHCCSVPITSEQIKYLDQTYNSYIAKIPIKNSFNRNKYEPILIKFRPYLRTFLKNLKNKFEIFVYTQATEEYATGIIQYINKNFQEDILSTGRMIPRTLDENGITKNKSIKNVFPTQEKMVLIIDDNMEVWKENGSNLLCIYPYKFFSEKERATNKLFFFNNQEKTPTNESFLKVDYDNVLFCMTNLLLNIHRKFYDYYGKHQIMKNISRIINDSFKFILPRKKFYYHVNFDKLDLYIKKNKKKTKKEKNINEGGKSENNNNKNELDKQTNDANIDKKEIIDINAIKENKDSPNNQTNEKNIKENEKEIKENKINDEMKNNFKNTLKYKIQKLGGELIEDEKDKFNADLFLTDFYDTDDPVIMSIKNYNEKKIPIIHCHYIEICYMYFFGLKIDDFILDEKTKYCKFLDLKQIFEKNKVDIINFYGNNEFFDEK
jgi:FCP1-like phosphatase family protein